MMPMIPEALTTGILSSQPSSLPLSMQDNILKIPHVPADDLGRHEFVFGMELLELQKFAEPFVLRLHGNEFHIVLTQVVVLRLECRIFFLQRPFRRKKSDTLRAPEAAPPTMKLMGLTRVAMAELTTVKREEGIKDDSAHREGQ
mgnify:CR=1 FL=1